MLGVIAGTSTLGAAPSRAHRDNKGPVIGKGPSFLSPPTLSPLATTVPPIRALGSSPAYSGAGSLASGSIVVLQRR